MKDALELAGKLGIGGGVGFLLSWPVVYWIEPATRGGFALLIILSVVFCSTLGGIVSKFVAGKTQKAENDKKQPTEEAQPKSRKNTTAPLDSWTC
jgi:hypothetical protein